MDVWPEDWAYAQLRTQETNRPAPHVKRFKDLVPGDRYAWLGDEFEVLTWPRDDHRHVWTMQIKNSLETLVAIRINPEQDVAAWKGRDVNYGHARCGHCLCFVGRDHVPGSEECLAIDRERRDSESDWEVDW